MAVIAIHHVQLAMPPGGEAAADAFYAGVLGLTNVPKPAHLAVRGGCWFENHTTKVHLGVEADFRPAAKAHPALLIDDLDALVAACTAAGHPIRDGDGVEGYEQVYVDDPFGNRIELLGARP
ncbi:MAG TPA: VOC family protein [Acidimicrobiales bacterium]|jgi:catechol 2,3-dioxygenase-like lactoylglutathione lyase family enzyme